MMKTLRDGANFCIAKWQASGSTHDASKKTSEMTVRQNICPLFDLFVLNSLSKFVKKVVQKTILLERN